MSEPLNQWRGGFGDDYIARNPVEEKAVRQRMLMWGRLLWSMQPDLPRSILEVGCNVGINLQALSILLDAELFAIEPNDRAREEVLKSKILPADHLFGGDATKLPVDEASVDLSFSTGVLIHVHPDDLAGAVDELYRVTRRHILICEYFSDQPESKPYRGQEGLLFKRDFGKFMLERHPDLLIVDYGFFWREATGLDNGNWWIFRKPA